MLFYAMTKRKAESAGWSYRLGCGESRLCVKHRVDGPVFAHEQRIDTAAALLKRESTGRCLRHEQRGCDATEAGTPASFYRWKPATWECRRFPLTGAGDGIGDTVAGDASVADGRRP